ncbi:predicted protein [Streptomyces iranensis]|uniref:Uncharacterized protein n=1 Tax=Streptomyces iranensis TaxID=576784 RepID=A0A061A5J7_9ACTN|nr:predicted protein [Streptomyces iranensis]
MTLEHSQNPSFMLMVASAHCLPGLRPMART